MEFFRHDVHTYTHTQAVCHKVSRRMGNEKLHEWWARCVFITAISFFTLVYHAFSLNSQQPHFQLSVFQLNAYKSYFFSQSLWVAHWVTNLCMETFSFLGWWWFYSFNAHFIFFIVIASIFKYCLISLNFVMRVVCQWCSNGWFLEGYVTW